MHFKLNRFLPFFDSKVNGNIVYDLPNGFGEVDKSTNFGTVLRGKRLIDRLKIAARLWISLTNLTT